MKQYCVFGSHIIPLSKAGLPLNDLGILRGYAVFDFLRTYNGKPFLFNEHWARFKRSAHLVGLSIPIAKSVALQLMVRLMKKYGVKNASFRLVLTGGSTINGMTSTAPLFYILYESLHTLPASVYTKGAKLITQEYLRPFPGAKTTHYLMAITLQGKKRRASAVEVLYVHNKLVYEASTSNIFIISKGALVTPKDSVLPGITRALVIKLARTLKLKIVERPVLVKELFTADEVFITATNKELTPIVAVDRREVGGGVPGPVTQQLLRAYRQYCSSY